jgi:hypothetical protein
MAESVSARELGTELNTWRPVGVRAGYERKQRSD